MSTNWLLGVRMLRWSSRRNHMEMSYLILYFSSKVYRVCHSRHSGYFCVMRSAWSSRSRPKFVPYLDVTLNCVQNHMLPRQDTFSTHFLYKHFQILFKVVLYKSFFLSFMFKLWQLFSSTTGPIDTRIGMLRLLIEFIKITFVILKHLDKKFPVIVKYYLNYNW